MTEHGWLSKIKTTIPSTAGRMLVRGRLDAQLDACLAHRLTLVSAPAGFGKTTLVSAWARRVGERRRLAWVSVDKADRDGARLLRHIVAALRLHNPEIGGDVVSLLDSGHGADPLDLMHYLMDDLLAWGEPVVVVLDDFHLAAGIGLSRALEAAVRRLPACVRLVVVTRQQPALPLASWRASGWLDEMGPSQLAFQPAEVQAFLADSMALPAPAEVAELLHASTQGWAAALKMAALSLRYADAGTAALTLSEQAGRFDGRHRYIADFMATEVLRALPPRQRAFLRDCAVLQRMDASLCEAVTGQADAAALISQLERAHLLTRDGTCAWYRCPRLLRESLLSVLAPEAERVLHVRATLWWEQQGRAVEALDHALAAQDVQASVRLLCRTLDHSLHHGEVHAILAQLDALPESVVMGHLDLVGCRAWLLCLVGRSTEARQYAELAVRQRAAPGSGSGSAVLSVFCAYYELNWGDAGRAVEAARIAAARLGPEDVSLRIMVGSFLGQGLVMTGRPDEAIDVWRETLQLGQHARPAKALDVLFHLVPLMQAQGKLREARVLCEQAIAQHRDAAGRPLAFAGPAHVAMALVLRDVGDLPAACSTAESALALCRKLGVVYYELHAQRALARILWARGERDLAWRALAESRERLLAAQSPRRAGIVELLAAELHVAAGQLQPALRALAHPSLATFAPLDDRVVLLRAQALLLQQRPQDALQLLERQQEVARKFGFDGSCITIAVLQARCWQRIGNKPAERRCLERALVQASFSGARSALMEEGAPLAATLVELQSSAPEFAATLALPLPASAEAQAAALDPLTQRDVAVLVLLERGLRNQEIADQLTITIGTTKQYVNRLFAKLGVRNRVEAVSIGRRLQLLP